MRNANGEPIDVRPAAQDAEARPVIPQPPVRSIPRAAVIGLAAIGGVLMLGQKALADCSDVCSSEFNWACYGGGEYLGSEPCHGGDFYTIFGMDYTSVFTDYSGGGYEISSPCMGYSYSFCSIFTC